jgi:hypothetical protein
MKKTDRQSMYNITLRCVRVTTVAIEKQLHILSVCFLAVIRQANCIFSVPHYAATCGLSGYTTMLDITSYTVRFSENKLLNTKCVF